MNLTKKQDCGFAIVLYDGNCPMCCEEMAWLSGRDKNHRLRFVNVAHPEFDAAAWHLEKQALNTAIHVRTTTGNWLVGMPAIRYLYVQIGLGWVLAVTGWPLLAPVFDWLYLHLAKNRIAVSAWFGLNSLNALNSREHCEQCVGKAKPHLLSVLISHLMRRTAGFF